MSSLVAARYRDQVRFKIALNLRQIIMDELLKPEYQEMLNRATNYSLGREYRSVETLEDGTPVDDMEWWAEKDRQMQLIVNQMMQH